MNSIVLHQYCSVTSEKMSVLYYCKLNNLGHINITSIMKRLNGWGEREGSQLISSCTRPVNFLYFLRTFRKFPGNSVIVPSLDRKRYPPWAYSKLPYRAWENCSGQCKGLFQAQKRKITMTSKENRNFCYSVLQCSARGRYRFFLKGLFGT
jgi:hypothetical protein